MASIDIFGGSVVCSRVIGSDWIGREGLSSITKWPTGPKETAQRPTSFRWSTREVSWAKRSLKSYLEEYKTKKGISRKTPIEKRTTQVYEN